MPRSLRIATPAALAALTALTLASCAAPAAEPGDPTVDTVTVANAAPVFTAAEDPEASDQTVVDYEQAAGSVEVPFQPESIVTFDLATLDTLDAIGYGDRVVGIPEIGLPEYLSQYADLPKVGSLFEPDFEAVAELDPELIVTAARSSAAYDELAEIATTIDLTGGFAGRYDTAAGLERAAQLGEIFGAEDEVAALAQGIRATESEVQALTADAGDALFLITTGGDYGAFAEDSRFGYFFETLGFSAVVPAAELPGAEGSPHGDAVSNEFILTVNPDWLLVLDRGAATGEVAAGDGAAEVLDNELVAQTTAWSEGQVIYLPSSDLYIVVNGLTAMQNVVDAVLAGLEG